MPFAPQDFVSASWVGKNWTMDASIAGVELCAKHGTSVLKPDELRDTSVTRRFWGLGRAAVYISGEDRRVPLPRLSRGNQREITRHFDSFVALRDAQQWVERVATAIDCAQEQLRWVDSETIEELRASRPDDAHLRDKSSEQGRRALDALNRDLARLFSEINEEIVQAELEARRWFFDSIEKSPMTEEQARAVIAYDNRVQVVAAAGSGKTSVMVARAAYAIEKGFVQPDEIVLLAFNRDAANELQTRIEERLSLAGLPTEGIKASTFHALGLAAIGKARGKRPSLAPWVENSQEELGVLSEIVDLLRDESQRFRETWDLYRLIFAPAPVSGPQAGRPDAPLEDSKKERGFRTFDGKAVRSEGERQVANWLFLNGVPYHYELPYLHDTADETHSQYKPDFFYPAPVDDPSAENQPDCSKGTWHEHWGLNRNGDPPKEFGDYAEGMNWKRSLHEAHQTDLIETSWWGVLNGNDLQFLGEQLEARGHQLDWNPSRVPEKEEPVTNEQLIRLIRTFMSHAKSNSLSREDLERRLKGSLLEGTRSEMFLRLYWPIFEAWEERLLAGGYIDFDDMLIQAADHLENRDVDLGYSLVLADEFQDASNARIRILKGLVATPGRHLLTVGDDWQSINRFAGSDISAMLDFETVFGTAVELQLTRTFRCPPDIVEFSSSFVQKNPGQIAKHVTTSTPEPEPSSVRLVIADINEEAVEEELAEIVKRASKEPDTKKPTVLALGRYGFDQDLIPRSAIPEGLDFSFKTIHRSKGLEADYVIILNLSARGWSFPASVIDDPMLGLAMTKPDEFLFAEERRLFYVALTRARRQVILLVPERSPSEFIIEAYKDGILRADFPLTLCNVCTTGLMVRRDGPHGDFFGCSNYPSCNATAQVCEHCDQGCLVRNGDFFDCNQPLCDRESFPTCPACGEGMLAKRQGPRSTFFGCTQYPTCDNTTAICPACGTGALIRDFNLVRCHKHESCGWHGRPCPNCSDGILITREGAYGPFTSCSNFTSTCDDPKAIKWRRSRN